VWYAFLNLPLLLIRYVWVLIYLMEDFPLIKDVSLNSFPPPLPLAKAPQPIDLSQGLYFVVLALHFFPCVITTYALIPFRPIRAP
jgi:hypothetical protein